MIVTSLCQRPVLSAVALPAVCVAVSAVGVLEARSLLPPVAVQAQAVMVLVVLDALVLGATGALGR